MRLDISSDHALVLFEWLARTRVDGTLEGMVDPAEQRVLWDLEAVLEAQLVETFDPDYQALLDAARDRITSGAA